MQGLQNLKTHADLKCESVWFKTRLVSQFLTFSFLLSQPFFIPYLHAAPVGGDIVGGTGSISQSDLTTTVNQASQNLAVNWQSFDINANEKVNFIQPNTSSIALNRILGNNGSTIQGQINANGQVILVNPNGIIFTPNATINVGGLVASSLDIKPTDFMNGNYIFNEVIGSDGAVINSGIINASLGGNSSTGGNVALLGKKVKNEGLISANLGSVALAAGKQSVLTFDNQGLIGVKVTKEVLQNEVGLEEAVINSGTINASGGRVLLTASTSQDVFSQAVNSNVEQATSVVVNPDGSFTLGGGADVLNTGSIDVSSATNDNNTARIVLLGENVTSSGKINADVVNGNAGDIEIHANEKLLLSGDSVTSAQAIASGTGGHIKVLGDKIGLFDQSSINASGANGGGEILVGGDRQGQNPFIRNANFIYLGADTTINADASGVGNGGKIITFAKDTARIRGDLFARGGSISGNGGFIETSGLHGFEITRAPDVSASNGSGGLWLIDPYNISIINGSGAAPTLPPPAIPGVDYTQSGGNDFFSSAANDASLDVRLIQLALASGNVEINTGSAGSQLGNIRFLANLDYDSAGNSTRTLTLKAANNITFENGSSITDTSRVNGSLASLNLILNADTNNNGSGDVVFNGSTINTFGGYISIIDAMNITGITNASSINTGNGNFTLSTTGSFATTSFDSGLVSLNVGTGNINLDAVSGAVNLGNITETGGGNNNLNIRNATSISQTAGTSINVLDRARFGNTTSTTSIVLANAANNFGTIRLRGQSATIQDTDAIVISDGTDLTTLLDITAGGAITDSGTLVVSNASGTAQTLLTSTAGITLDNGDGNNNFNNLNLRSATNANIEDSTGGIVLAANNGFNSGGVSGNLTVKAIGGDITSFGEINAGTSTLTDTATFIVDDSFSILLGNSANTFGGNVVFSSAGQINNITITDDTALNLPDINIAGTLNVTADSIEFLSTTVVGTLNATTTNAIAGDIIQNTGVLNITGVSTFDATRDVLLGSDNNFQDTVAVVKARDVTLADITGINLGKITMSGNLNVTSDSNNSGTSTQNITQLATAGNALSVAGTSTFTAGNYDVILTNSENDFNSSDSLTGSGAVSVTANIAQITDKNSLDIANASLSTNNAQESVFTSGAGGAGGDITQYSAAGTFINDAGSGSVSRFNANGGNITLNSTTNDFRVVRVDSALNASFTDTDYFTLGDINVSGDLSVIAAITSTSNNSYIRDLTGATISVGGSLNLTSRTFGGTNRDILLDSTNADYNNINIINARNVDITDNTGSVGIQGAISGNLTLTAKGTSASNVITNPGSLIVTGNSDFIANANESIQLDNGFNSFSTDPVFTAASGTLNNISITDITALQIQDNLNIQGNLVANASTVRLQNATVGTNLNLTATSTIDQAGGKSVTVSGTSTFNGTSVDFSNSGNDFQAGVVSTNNTAVVTLRDDTGGISLGTAASGFVSNSLIVDSNGGDITQNNNIVTVNASFDSASNNTVLNTNANNDFTGNVIITNARDAFITDFNSLNISESNTSRDLNVSAGDSLSFGLNGASVINVGRDLVFSAGGNVTQATGSSIVVAGNSQMSANSGVTNYDITLNSINNDFTSVFIQAANTVSLRDSTTSLDIGGTISNNMNIIMDDSASGDILTNTNALNVAGNTNITTLADQSINLGNTGNIFAGTINFSNTLNNLVLIDTTALTLQNNLNINNDLTINAQSLRFNNTNVGRNLVATTSSGIIDQTALTNIFVNNSTALDGGSGGIDLRSNNNFNGVVTLQTTGSDVQITDANTITFGLSNIQGGLTVRAADIAQVDTAAVDGITVLNTASFIGNANSDIILNNPDNNFNIVSFSASAGRLRNVSITNSANLNLSTISVTNNLTAVSSGDITNSGTLTVDNLFTANANNITLGNVSNNFNNITLTAANDALIADQNSLNFFGNTSILNNLTVNAAQNITDDAASTITVTSGLASFNAGSSVANTIILDALNHDFNQVRVNAGGDVKISDINGFDLGTSNLGANLYLVADSDNNQVGGNISNSGGAITVSGFTDITTSSGSDITLTNINNNFAGYLTFTETGATPLGTINLQNSNTTTLNNLNAANLTITSTGALSGNIEQTATSSINVSGNTLLAAGSADINLNNTTNNFSTLNITSSGNATLTDINSLTVGTINAAGVVRVKSNGLNLGAINANIITLDSGLSSINDVNGTNINITSSGTVDLTATGGIGTVAAPLDLAMNGATSNLRAINSGAGDISLINSGDFILKEVKNKAAGGAFSLDNTGTVTIESLIIDRNSDLSIAKFNVRSGSVLGVQGAIDSNNEKVHISANTAIFNMNNTGTIGQLGQTLIAKVPNKIEVIASLGTYIEYFGQVPPKTFIGDNDYRNRALQAIENLSGQQLIQVESLAEIDPAIFTDVRNYNHSDVALMMPADQRYGNDEEDDDAKNKRNKFLNSKKQ